MSPTTCAGMGKGGNEWPCCHKSEAKDGGGGNGAAGIVVEMVIAEGTGDGGGVVGPGGEPMSAGGALGCETSFSLHLYMLAE